MNDFIITPFESVITGSEIFRLDATFEDINQEWGEAGRILIDNIMRQTTEYRSACELIYRHEGRQLKSIVCSKHTHPTLNGLPVFSAESIAAWKAQHDYVEDEYYLTFPDLGICIGGMGGKKIPKGEDRLVIAFARSEIEYYKMFVQI
ncbi:MULTISPECIES: hypothetical protein [Eikenella]|uniref:Uncharacterized protein n=1 Tax=Eikenella longinqua TaxID=1795827 RepID=A0A1A9RVI5_9NEIS|nr:MULTISPECIES: hypothetical protein [Eikenella]OAM26136.1 hypothetical protein A7P95_10560 [Eikenella longinqua]